MTIPRLELLALLIGIRLTKFVLKELKLKLTTINVYSDSQKTTQPTSPPREPPKTKWPHKHGGQVHTSYINKNMNGQNYKNFNGITKKTTRTKWKNTRYSFKKEEQKQKPPINDSLSVLELPQ
ncbi:hypothetical protein TELCIR_14246, partial [Teladorsagia circumcincta]